MKKKMLGVLLPVVAGLALAGTGFGAWVFVEGATTQYAAATINVTNAYGYKDFTATWTTDKNLIKLEQNDEHTGGADLGSLEFKVTYDANFGLGGTATPANPTGETNTNANYAYTNEAAQTLTTSYKIDVANSISKYVDFTVSVTESSSDYEFDGYEAPEKNATGMIIKDKITSTAETVKVTDTVSIALSWTSECPDTFAKWQGMRDVVKAFNDTDKGFVITLTAQTPSVA